MSGSKPRAFSAASRPSTNAMSLREYEMKTFAGDGSPLSRPAASLVMAQAVGARSHGGCIAREIARVPVPCHRAAGVRGVICVGVSLADRAYVGSLRKRQRAPRRAASDIDQMSQSPRNRVGRVQRNVVRAFVVADGRSLIIC